MKTKLTVVDKWDPSPLPLLRAAKIIRSGGLVAFPTETVYGLGANACNTDAVKRIYEAKGRPSDNPLIVHVGYREWVDELAEPNDAARDLMWYFWPGPLTLVLKSKPLIPPITRGGLDTVALRMPDNIIALKLLEHTRLPIAAPSANLSGRPSPTDADTVYQDMNGRIDMILDGGSVKVGIESTVIDVTNPEHVLLLRPGGLSREKIEKVLRAPLYTPDMDSSKRSPGTRYRHYSPSIPVKIWRRESDFPECDLSSTGYIGVHEAPVTAAKSIILEDYDGYASTLFSAFRQLEREGYTCVIAEWPDEDSGISEGLRDRILRAAMD